MTNPTLDEIVKHRKVKITWPDRWNGALHRRDMILGHNSEGRDWFILVDIEFALRVGAKVTILE